MKDKGELELKHNQLFTNKCRIDAQYKTLKQSYEAANEQILNLKD